MNRRKSAKRARLIIYLVAFFLLIAIVPWLITIIPIIQDTPRDGIALIDFGAVKDKWLDQGYLGAMWMAVTNRNLIVFSGMVIALLMLLLAQFLAPFGVLLDPNAEDRGDRKTPPIAGNGEFGTARWQTLKEMQESATVWYPADEPQPKQAGVVLGVDLSGRKEKVYLSTEDTHTLVLGTTRSGKTRSLLLPTIWALAAAGESMVLTDPKGELLLSTKEYLESKGYDVIAMNYREPEKSAYWNPLNKLMENLSKNDLSNAEQTAKDMAETFVNATQSKSTDSFWPSTAKSVISAISMLLAIETDNDEMKHLYGANILLGRFGRPKGDLEEIPLQQIIDSLPIDHPAYRAYLAAGISSARTRASIFANALTAIQVLADRKIGYITSRQDHSLRNVGLKKTAVFLVIPDEHTTYNVLATIYIDQLYQTLIELANEHGGRLPRRVNFILDEFGNLPAIPKFDTKLTVAGGRGIRFTMAIQGFDQLEALYNKAAGTIKGNCHTWIYLLTADVKTAKEIEERLGKYTISTTSQGVSAQYGGSSLRPSASSNVNLTGRSLVMATELTEWKPSDGAIVMRVREKPTRYPWAELGQYKANADFGLGASKEETARIYKERNEKLEKKEIKTPKVWMPDEDCFKSKFKGIGELELDPSESNAKKEGVLESLDYDIDEEPEESQKAGDIESELEALRLEDEALAGPKKKLSLS